MKRVRRLSEIEVRRAGPGWHNDGGGLYLRVDKTGGAYWFFRWGSQGRRYFSLGPRHILTLRSARTKAAECQTVVRDHRDPRAEHKAKRTAAKLAAANEVTFTQVIDRYFVVHQSKWGAATARDWRNRLRTHIEPALGEYAVSAIDTKLVVQALTPLWTKEMVKVGQQAQRAMAKLLDFAKTSDLRTGDNPAQWKGHLDQLLASPEKLAPVQHYPAMPYAEVPAFLAELRQVPGVVARCFEFCVLTATRRDEARNALWPEIEGYTWTWIIPAARMKMERAHRVPLSEHAQAVLQQIPAPKDSLAKGRIFQGRSGGGFGNSAMNDLLDDMRPGSGYTVHGFRSSFRDWAAEQTSFSHNACELALAHEVGSDTEQAYLRTDMLDERRKLMEAWGRFCAGETAVPAGAVPIRASAWMKSGEVNVKG
jgi:integrase